MEQKLDLIGCCEFVSNTTRNLSLSVLLGSNVFSFVGATSCCYRISLLIESYSLLEKGWEQQDRFLLFGGRSFHQLCCSIREQGMKTSAIFLFVSYPFRNIDRDEVNTFGLLEYSGNGNQANIESIRRTEVEEEEELSNLSCPWTVVLAIHVGLFVLFYLQHDFLPKVKKCEKNSKPTETLAEWKMHFPSPQQAIFNFFYSVFS